MEPLTARLADERGEVVDRRDVGDLIEAEEQWVGGRVRGGAPVGRVADLLEQPDDERRAEGLAVRERGDVDGVRRGGELFGVEVRAVGGVAGGVGVVEGEDYLSVKMSVR